MSGFTNRDVRPHDEELGARETMSLIAASKVNGTEVFNQAGESLGAIHDVMIDKRSGQVSYAVMSFGGFLGLGEKYFPLPWSRLTYHEAYGGYVVELDKADLEGAPSYQAQAPDWSQPGYADTIDQFWGRPAI